MAKINELIKELRKQKNLTQKDLAEICNVHQDCISKWECGKSKPNFYNLIKLAKYFQVKADYLLSIKEFSD